ncbi:MAG: glycosyltransferase family 2 protein [Myxococcales bacterium]|nr:glycosyltransferase family 2 protein [Myxococcales bacterium]
MAKRFDTRAWRLAEKLAIAPKAAYRYVQEQSPALVKRWDPAAHTAQIPPEAGDLCAGLVTKMTISEKLKAFRHSVASGAHGVAAPLAKDLYQAIPQMVQDAQRRAVAALGTHHIATGEEDQFEKLRLAYEEHQHAHTIDALSISERIDKGQLAPHDVDELLCRHWREVLKNPQLHLLAHRSTVAAAPAQATAALNRYLRAVGGDEVESVGNSGHYLRDLRMAEVPKVEGGPLVSILVSTFNAEETIGYVMRSLLGQSYQNIEILVCDDASTDETTTVIREQFGDHPRVSLYRSEDNQGTYNIRNALIARARGELITVHDADDVCMPRRIELQAKQLRVPTKKASIANLLRVQPDGRVEFFRDRNANRMAIVSLMASRRVFAELGPYRSARFGADFEFLERLKARYGAGSIARVHSPQLLCLWAEQSATKQSGAQALSTGYRSPARRLYGDLVYRQRVLGNTLVSDDDIDSQLRESGNWRAPSALVEV